MEWKILEIQPQSKGLTNCGRPTNKFPPNTFEFYFLNVTVPHITKFSSPTPFTIIVQPKKVELFLFKNCTFSLPVSLLTRAVNRRLCAETPLLFHAGISQFASSLVLPGTIVIHGSSGFFLKILPQKETRERISIKPKGTRLYSKVAEKGFRFKVALKADERTGASFHTEKLSDWDILTPAFLCGHTSIKSSA